MSHVICHFLPNFVQIECIHLFISSNLYFILSSLKSGFKIKIIIIIININNLQVDVDWERQTDRLFILQVIKTRNQKGLFATWVKSP